MPFGKASSETLRSGLGANGTGAVDSTDWPLCSLAPAFLGRGEGIGKVGVVSFVLLN